METIKLNEMPVAAQKAYASTNKIRKATLFIAYAGMILTIIIAFFSSLGKDFFSEMFFKCFIGGMLSCGIHGLVHAEFIFKKLCKFAVSLGLLFGLFALIPYAAVIAGAIYFGFIFVIIDTILFIKQKPLVYRFEHKKFLETKQAQAEMAASAYSRAEQLYESEVAMGNLQKLKEMFEDGLISENEFNAKKSELLGKI